MDEEEINELIEQIDEIEDEEVGRHLLLELFDQIGVSEKLG